MMRDNIYVFILVFISTIMPNDPNLQFYLGVACAIGMGIALRVGMQVRNKTFSFWGFIAQFLITIPVSWFSYQLWLVYLNFMPLPIYLFIVSFSSLYTAKLIEKASRIGLNGVAQYLLKTIAATNPGSEKEEET